MTEKGHNLDYIPLCKLVVTKKTQIIDSLFPLHVLSSNKSIKQYTKIKCFRYYSYAAFFVQFGVRMYFFDAIFKCKNWLSGSAIKNYIPTHCILHFVHIS